LVAANSGAVALVFIFFSCGQDFPRSSLGRGWRELPFADCRLKKRCGSFFPCQSAIVNQQSSIGNELKWETQSERLTSKQTGV
jgi:hypothetical protein